MRAWPGFVLTYTSFTFASLVGCAPDFSLVIDPTPTPDAVLRDRVKVPYGVHMTSYQIPGVFLGECADGNGNITGQKCIEKAPEVQKNDLTLPGGTYRYYSQLVDIKGSAAVNMGAGEGSSSVTVSTHKFVMEWARFKPQTINLPNDFTKPAVTAVDVGIAVRVVFEAKLKSASAAAAAGFGFGELSTQLALDKVDVQASYDTVGPLKDILPKSNVFTIRTVEDFVKAQNTFYDAIVAVSSAWDEEKAGGPARVQPKVAEGQGIATLQAPSEFAPDIIGYTVSNLRESGDYSGTASMSGGYLTGVAAIMAGYSCTGWLKKMGKDETGDGDFVNGYLRAVHDILGTTTCDGTLPDKIQKAKAETAWKGYLLPRRKGE